MKKNVCSIHGEMNEENAYSCKNPNGTIRLRCKECVRTQRAAYYYDNQAAGIAKAAAWKKANREIVHAQTREDREKNPEKYRKWSADSYARNPEKMNTATIISAHKIHRDDYYALIEKQQNLCAICGEEEAREKDGKKMRLCLDHDHETMKIRGLLCHACNTGIGKLRDSVDLVRKALEYLELHKD